MQGLGKSGDLIKRFRIDPPHLNPTDFVVGHSDGGKSVHHWRGGRDGFVLLQLGNEPFRIGQSPQAVGHHNITNKRLPGPLHLIQEAGHDADHDDDQSHTQANRTDRDQWNQPGTQVSESQQQRIHQLDLTRN